MLASPRVISSIIHHHQHILLTDLYPLFCRDIYLASALNETMIRGQDTNSSCWKRSWPYQKCQKCLFFVTVIINLEKSLRYARILLKYFWKLWSTSYDLYRSIWNLSMYMRRRSFRILWQDESKMLQLIWLHWMKMVLQDIEKSWAFFLHNWLPRTFNKDKPLQINEQTLDATVELEFRTSLNERIMIPGVLKWGMWIRSHLVPHFKLFD